MVLLRTTTFQEATEGVGGRERECDGSRVGQCSEEACRRRGHRRAEVAGEEREEAGAAPEQDGDLETRLPQLL
jgi:hypothetical protein